MLKVGASPSQFFVKHLMFVHLVFPHIINACVFTSAFSAGNSFLFCGSRILYGLSLRGQAPRIFAYCTKNGLPIIAVMASVSASIAIAGITTHLLHTVLLCIFGILERFKWRFNSFQVTIFLSYLGRRLLNKRIAGSSVLEQPVDSLDGFQLT